jgi:hypothetical protein
MRQADQPWESCGEIAKRMGWTGGFHRLRTEVRKACGGTLPKALKKNADVASDAGTEPTASAAPMEKDNFSSETPPAPSTTGAPEASLPPAAEPQIQQHTTSSTTATLEPHLITPDGASAAENDTFASASQPPTVQSQPTPPAPTIQPRDGVSSTNRIAGVVGNGKRVTATEAQQRAIFAICKSQNLDVAAVLADFNVSDSRELHVKDASKLIDQLKSRAAAR